MNADMKKLRQELLRGRARRVPCTIVFGGGQTRLVRCRCWRVVPLTPATPVRDEALLWHERVAKLANRAVAR
jgi:hypothetical protein